MFAHTVREASRLGLGVDLTTGTGWPFGGSNVTASIAAKQWKVSDGKLTTSLTNQQVKRAAPGGAGLVVDYFDKTAMRTYLNRFDSTLARLPQKPRAVYNDSYEVYGANWSENFASEFRKRRGYDLNSQLSAFLDTTGTEVGILVKQDYHQTLSELLHDGFTATWTGWARSKGYKTRNQAHGSPGNLLDLYALTDIPETESFGSSRFPIPGLRVDDHYDVERFGTPHPLAMKFASSAANLMGKPLVSSETTTWLANHFHVSLSQIKPQVDELFTGGSIIFSTTVRLIHRPPKRIRAGCFMRPPTTGHPLISGRIFRC
ncbi:glycosyl hydrolase [Spirosoma sp. KNUC1025]|uniref:glycosyl hydrolase n=1 Tax=Spirosoma sp. KNUC1025 TaxID=2894082 RepID=UPI00386BF8D7